MGKLVFALFVIFILSLSSNGGFVKGQKPKPEAETKTKDVSEWVRKISYAKEKVTHIHFFVHDTLSGSNQTAFTIAESAITNTSQFRFGLLDMIDDPLTEGPELTSKPVGRLQGIWGSTALQEWRLVMAVNVVFTTGEFNGSTLSILANNPILEKSRELPIVGGTGVFRLARGFAMLKTYQFNLTSGNAVVEYNVVAIHY